MIKYWREHLGAKLLLSYFSIILVGAAVLILTSQSILPESFNRHMAGMAGGGMMGMNGSGVMSQLYLDYRASFNEAL